MVVIKTEEDFWSSVERGYTPYLMRSQNRWYMRRGQKRHIITRELDELAIRVVAKAGVKHRKPIRAGVIQEMRLKGAPVEDIAEETGLSRSGVYYAFERGPEELVRPRGKAEIKGVQDTKRVLEEVRFLGKVRREKHRCFDVNEGTCMRGLNVEVEGFEFMKHEHPAPIPLVPPAIDYHVKPDLEFCAVCPFSYDYSFDLGLFEACFKTSRQLKALKKKSK